MAVKISWAASQSNVTNVCGGSGAIGKVTITNQILRSVKIMRYVQNLNGSKKIQISFI